MKWYTGRAKPATVTVLTALLLGSVGASDLYPADRNLAEFKQYVAGKLPGIGDAQLDRFAKMVDKKG